MEVVGEDMEVPSEGSSCLHAFHMGKGVKGRGPGEPHKPSPVTVIYGEHPKMHMVVKCFWIWMHLVELPYLT